MRGKAAITGDVETALFDWTVGDLLAHAARAAPDHVALKKNQVFDDDEAFSWTYAQLRLDTLRLANFLLTHFRPGEAVAIWGANSAQWTLYQLAAARAGLILVTLNPALRGAEAGALLAQSRAAGLIHDSRYRDTDLAGIASTLKPTLPALRVLLRSEDWQSHLAAGTADELPACPAPKDPALLLFTSGTTGKPKGVVLSHSGIVNNAWFGSLRWRLAPHAGWMGVLPLFHIGGSVTSTLGCITRLGTNIVVPSFEPGLVLRLIESERAAWMPAVPTMVIRMMEHESFKNADLSSLRVLSLGGTTITPEFIRRTRAHFDADIMVMFGQTEAGGGLTKSLRHDSLDHLTQTVGFPFPHTSIRIADAATGETLGFGEPGEIRVKSPYMTTGYIDNPEANAAAFDEFGYLRTGDLGSLNEQGYLSIKGRLKEMIIRGGENIYPREIEDRLGEYPGIVEAAVVGVPSERWGEEIAAAIRCEFDQAIDIAVLCAFLKDRLARYKIPKYWEIVTEFPRTPMGKIQKFEVARWFASAP